jgi:hypothetical protein
MAYWKGKLNAGQGGKVGHSNMSHWVGTKEIKDNAKKARRAADKVEIKKGSEGMSLDWGNDCDFERMDEEEQLRYLRGQVQSLISQLDAAKKGLNLFANVMNWQSAGTYKGEASGVYIWNGWLHGIKGDPFELATETLAEMEKLK